MTPASQKPAASKPTAWRGGDLDALFETTFKTIRDGDPLPPCVRRPLLCRTRLQGQGASRQTTAP